jgi:hypothetical protein
VIWIGIEFISVENALQNLISPETLLYCAADGSDTETDDDHDNGRSGDGESDDDEEEFFDTKDSLKSSGSIQKQTSVSEVDMELVGLNYPEVHRKKSLPQPKEKENSVSLWSMIKDNIGKDLSKICLPVYFNEPISSLQRCPEDVDYSYLLHHAYEYGTRVMHTSTPLKSSLFSNCCILPKNMLESGMRKACQGVGCTVHCPLCPCRYFVQNCKDFHVGPILVVGQCMQIAVP